MIRSIKNWILFNFRVVKRIKNILLYWKSSSKSVKISQNRRELSIFEIDSLSSDMPNPHKYTINENNLYGNGLHIFPSYQMLDVDYTVIEHGFVFGSLVQHSLISSVTNSVVTFSDYRQKYISQKTDKEIICVGPYIHYAASEKIMQPSEKAELKKELGKTLLVFPSHSLPGLNIEFNNDDFYKCIKENAKEFDNVIVCLYYADIVKGFDKQFLNLGYKVVTAGHIYDLFFLDRLKLIFELSDGVLSNSIGTHIGYSIYLKKPLVLFEQEFTFQLNDKSDGELSQRSEHDNETLLKMKRQLYDLFKHSQYTCIEDNQYEVISELFGFKYINNNIIKK